MILFRLGVMDGVITVGSSGGLGLAGAGAEGVSGYGVGVAQGSRVTSYGSATGGGTGGAFLGGMPVGLSCWGRGRGDPWRGRDGDLRGVVVLFGVASRLRGCSFRLARRLVAVTIMSPYGRGAGIGRCQRKL